MSVYNFIKGLFGLPNQNHHLNRDNFGDSEPLNKFRKPIWSWEDDEDDDDDDDGLNERTQTPFGFRVFSNPVEIHRFFEHQMNEMLKMFQGFDQSSIFSQEGPMFGHDGSMFGMPSLPFPSAPGDSDMEAEKPGTGRSLRDYYLKPGYDMQPEGHKYQERQDSDLDDRVKSGKLGPILENLPSSSDSQPDRHRRSGWYRSVITFSTIRPDGSVEEHRTVDNDNGKEETVTRRIGDKAYTVTTSTDSDGTQTRTERFANMEKDSLNDFEKNWNGSSVPGLQSPATWFPFDKWFK